MDKEDDRKSLVMIDYEAFKTVREENQRLRVELARKEAALAFCKECMNQGLDVELWLEKLDSLERGEE